MPLSDSALSAAIKTQIETKFTIPSWSSSDLEKFCDAIAKAVVTHITSAAEVTGTCPSGGGALTLGKVT
jgi:hypothetical protein